MFCVIIVLLILFVVCWLFRLLIIGKVIRGVDVDIWIVLGIIVYELIIVGWRLSIVVVLCFVVVEISGIVFIILIGEIDVLGCSVIFMIVVILCFE